MNETTKDRAFQLYLALRTTGYRLKKDSSAYPGVMLVCIAEARLFEYLTECKEDAVPEVHEHMMWLAKDAEERLRGDYQAVLSGRNGREAKPSDPPQA